MKKNLCQSVFHLFMNGQFLLNTAVLLAVAGWLAGAWSLWARRSRQGIQAQTMRPLLQAAAWWPAARVLTWLTVIFLTGAVFYMALLLLAGDYAILYVWKHSASYQTAGQRLSALLAGQEGSFLLWTWLTGLIALWTAERFAGRVGEQRRDGRVIHLVLLALVVALLLITGRSLPFQSMAAAFPELTFAAAPVEGRGLNPVLLNPWMPLHTFFTFAGYALIGLVFAIGWLQLVRMAQGRPAAVWNRRRTTTVRWAWLLLSLALLTGIIWAYEEMTFGWFWSWDPVEASALAIWLLLTAALHVPGRVRSTDSEQVLAPFLAALPLLAVVFASFVTRSGLHPSVHAFAGGAAGRYLGLFLVALILALAVPTFLARQRTQGRLRRRSDQMAGIGLSPGSTGRAARWAMGLLLGAGALILWGVSFPLLAGQWQTRPVDLDITFFNLWGYLVALALLFVIGWEWSSGESSRRQRFPLLALFVTLTVITAFIKPVAGLELIAPVRRLGAGLLYETLGRASILSLFPAVVYALLAVGERWWWRVASIMYRNSRSQRWRESGLALIHAGVVVALVGAAISSLLATTVTVAINPLVSPAGSKDGITVRILGLTESEQVDAQGTIVAQQETVDLEVYTGSAASTDSGQVLVATGQAHVTIYPEREMGRHARVMISRGLIFDTQVIYHGLSEATAAGVPVTVRRIPLANLIWTGLLLSVLGLVMVMGSQRVTVNGKRVTVNGKGLAGKDEELMVNGQPTRTTAVKSKRKVRL
jgi:cytochrome c biogenesis factor